MASETLGDLGTITVEGWNRIAELERGQPGAKPEQIFVAMWFDESVSSAFEGGIRPAIEDAGYVALRIDQKEFVSRIDDEIIAEIRQSRAVVADFTGQRGGVYYEAGFAHGLGLPVIMTVEDSDVANLHFDTNHYNHILWRKPADLRRDLKNRLLAVLGRGPVRPAA